MPEEKSRPVDAAANTLTLSEGGASSGGRGVPDGGGGQFAAGGEPVAARYAIERQLGSGGMGEAYLAEDIVLHRKVVLKRLKRGSGSEPRNREAVLIEAKRSSAISNPHIAQVFDVVQHGDETVLVMEYIQGANLRGYVGAPISPAKFFSIAVQLSEAIGAAHASAILHCDIKPENVILMQSGFVKVLDFGLAQIIVGAGGSARAAAEQTITVVSAGSLLCGTPGYMAPEVLREEPASEQSDIFSLGVVFYELLTGKSPFKGRSTAESIARTLTETAPVLEVGKLGMPQEMARILEKMLARRPDERYATIRDLLVDLRACERSLERGLERDLEGQATTTERITAYVRRHQVEEAAKAERRKRLIIAIPGLVLVAVLAAIAWKVLQQPEAKTAGSRAGAGMGAAAPGSGRYKLVAVIPFQLAGSEDEMKGIAAYSEGLRLTLTSQLARVADAHGLQVVPASEVRERHLTSAASAREQLGVDLVLEGSLQIFGKAVRVNYSLIDAGSGPKSGTALSSAKVDASTSEPFKLEDDVVAGVLNLLNVQLAKAEQDSLTRHGTQSAVAYAEYLRGLGYLEGFDDPANASRATESFRKAIAADRTYAAAYAGAGEAQWRQWEKMHTSSSIELARTACAKALELDVELAEAHVCLGRIAQGTGDDAKAADEYAQAVAKDANSDEALSGLARSYERQNRFTDAESAYRKSIQLRPQYWANYYMLARFYRRQTRYDDAVKELRAALDQAPGNRVLYREMGNAYFLMGRLDDALRAYQQALQLAEDAAVHTDIGQVYFHQHKYAEAADAFGKGVQLDPQSYPLMANLADATLQQGQAEKAKDLYRRAIQLGEAQLKVNQNDVDVHMVLSHCHAALGDRDGATTQLMMALEDNAQDAEVLYYAARVYAQLNEPQLAINWLGKALARGYSRADIATAPDFESLHEVPEFQALLKQSADGPGRAGR